MKRTLCPLSKILTLCVLLVAPLGGLAANPNSETKLLPNDTDFFQQFGFAVALSQDTAVIGVPSDGINSGAAYIFARSGGVWSQQAKLLADDTPAARQFGFSVAINADTVVVGAPNDSGVGAAYVFVRSGASWMQQAKLVLPDPIGNDQFGTAVTIEGDTLAVGAVGTGQFFYYEGAVYVYARSAGTWTQQARLSSDVPGPGNEFGFSLALNNGTLAVGSPFDDDLFLADAGAVYIFAGSGTVWNLQAQLTASGAASDDRLGWSVALNGNTLVAGAPRNLFSADVPGSACVFVRNGADWSEQARLAASDGTLDDGFGSAVGVAGDTAVIGSPFDSSFAARGGSIYLFERSGVAWNQSAELAANDIGADYRFGISVAADGTTIMVGAPLAGDLNVGQFQNGAAYVYEPSSANTAPTAGPQAVTTAEDTPLAITLTGVDAEGAPLIFTVLSNPTNGTLTGSPPNLTYTPNANANGPDSFTFKANDGQLDSAPAIVAIAITPVNDPPVANSQSVNTLEDKPVAVTLTGSDVEGSPLTFTVLTPPAFGTLSGTPPNLTYTPNADANGPDSFTFKVNDGELDSAPATVSVNIAPVNDGPSISDVPGQTVVMNSSTGPVAFTVGDADNDPATLIVTGSSDNPTLAPDGNITFGGSGANRTLTVTPAANQIGAASIKVTVSDGLVATSTSFTLIVTRANNPPVADAGASPATVISPNNLNASVTLDGSRSSDADGDALTYRWYANGDFSTPIGSGVKTAVTLGIGTYSITLVVNDGSAGASDTQHRRLRHSYRDGAQRVSGH